jgi:hypothetical protein
MGVKKRDIFKIVKIGTGIAKVFVPGGVGKILDVVNDNIEDESDPANTESLKALAEVNDEQTEAIFALHTRLKTLEDKLKALEKK